MQKIWQNPIYLLIGSFFVLEVLVWLGITKIDPPSATLGAKTSSGVISAKENSFDFGTISMKKSEVTHIFELNNESEAPVGLGELYTSCMCTNARATFLNGEKSGLASMKGHGLPLNLNRTIQPGEKFEIEAIFDPAAHGPQSVDPVNRTIYLATNSSEEIIL